MGKFCRGDRIKVLILRLECSFVLAGLPVSLFVLLQPTLHTAARMTFESVSQIMSLTCWKPSRGSPWQPLNLKSLPWFIGSRAIWPLGISPLFTFHSFSGSPSPSSWSLCFPNLPMAFLPQAFGMGYFPYLGCSFPLMGSCFTHINT